MEPVTLKDSQHRYREGLLLELTGETGAAGWGEASPLPGFSRETLDETGHQLKGLASSFLGRDLSEDRLPIGDLLGREPCGQDIPPSARFGFELSVWNLYAESQGKTLPEVFSEEPGAWVSLNGLLSGTGERVVEEARRMREAGYEAVKLKVGSREVGEDAELARAVAGALGDSVALRLDANRAWGFEEAVEFFREASGVRYEYVEEPLAGPEGLSRLAGEYGVRVALDESLAGMEPGCLERHRYARAVVLKPTLLGGVSRTLDFAREAGRLGLVPVVSSAYETGVGTQALISLSASIGGGGIPAGLDTYRRLGADVLEPRPDLSAPRVNVLQATRRRVPNRDLLEPVYSSES